jgi:hypothetical protein
MTAGEIAGERMLAIGDSHALVLIPRDENHGDSDGQDARPYTTLEPECKQQDLKVIAERSRGKVFRKSSHEPMTRRRA